MQIGKGDIVFVPDFTFFASGEVVPIVGATPMFVDVETDTYNIRAESLEAAIQNVLLDGRYVHKAIISCRSIWTTGRLCKTIWDCPKIWDYT